MSHNAPDSEDVVAPAESRPRLIAYYGEEAESLPRIVPAARWRDWMNATHSRFANRCLPLLMANESGWMVCNPVAFEARWNGENDRSAVSVEFDEGRVPSRTFVESHFGYGILTWSVPYLFRTPPGYNILARGPANWPRDGISPLEGVIETDWTMATFTMNWKFTRPDHPVRFEDDEPFCVILPQRRGELEEFQPEKRPFSSDTETANGLRKFLERRERLHIRKFLGSHSDDYDEDQDSWQQDYFRGKDVEGKPAPEHQTKLRLKPFD